MLINNIEHKISGDLSDKYYLHFLSAGSYGDDVSNFLTSIIQDNWVCVDIGANIGLTTILMLTSASNVSVISFEPSPKNVSYLISNLNQNRYSNATVVPIGLGDEAGFAEFVDIPGFGAGSHVKSAADHPDAIDVTTVAIKIDTLDNYFSKLNLERLDLVKIDAEGYELNVIAGCKEVFKKFKPLVIIEFNSWFMTSVQKVNPLDVLNILFDIFKGLSVISEEGLRPIENSDAGKREFIKHNNEHGCVDNLLGYL